MQTSQRRGHSLIAPETQYRNPPLGQGMASTSSTSPSQSSSTPLQISPVGRQGAPPEPPWPGSGGSVTGGSSVGRIDESLPPPPPLPPLPPPPALGSLEPSVCPSSKIPVRPQATLPSPPVATSSAAHEKNRQRCAMENPRERISLPRFSLRSGRLDEGFHPAPIPLRCAFMRLSRQRSARSGLLRSLLRDTRDGTVRGTTGVSQRRSLLPDARPQRPGGRGSCVGRLGRTARARARAGNGAREPTGSAVAGQSRSDPATRATGFGPAHCRRAGLRRRRRS